MKSNTKTRALAGVAGSALVASALVGMTGGAASAVTSQAQFQCSVPAFKADMAYPATADITAVSAGGGKATVTLKLSAMPGIVPVAVPTPVPVKGKADATVDGAVVTLAGEGTADLSTARAPIAAPVMTGTAAVKSAKAVVDISKVDFTATAMGMTVDVLCVAQSGLKQTVDVAGYQVAPKVSVSAKANKKRVATVKVTVGGSQGKATGKVTVTVKKGKKTVKKSTVSLRKGKVTVKTKKLAKGKYTVTTAYKGSAAYKKATKKVAFKVK